MEKRRRDNKEEAIKVLLKSAKALKKTAQEVESSRKHHKKTINQAVGLIGAEDQQTADKLRHVQKMVNAAVKSGDLNKLNQLKKQFLK